MNGRSSTVVTALEDIPPWTFSEVPLLQERDNDNEEEEATASRVEEAIGNLGGGGTKLPPPPFKFDKEINGAVRLWQGHQWSVEADSISMTAAEGQDLHTMSTISRAASLEVNKVLPRLKRSRSADVRCTPSFGLPAKTILHSLAPRYSERYHTAAENALSQCYRSFLETAIENSSSSIALGNHSRNGTGYPSELAACILLRTVRRFAERYKGQFDTIVLCTGSFEEYESVARLMPLYFPRNKREEGIGARQLTQAHIGDALGEASLPERAIRIGDSFSERRVRKQKNTVDGAEDADDGSSQAGSPMTPDRFEPPPAARYGSPLEREEEEEESYSSSFMLPAPGPDEVRGIVRKPKPPSLEDRYREKWYKKAMRADLSLVNSMNIFRYVGIDLLGNPTFLFIGAHIKPGAVTGDDVVLQFIRELEAIGEQPFTIIYAHTEVSRLPIGVDFVSRVYNVMTRQQQTRLAAIFVLHPSLGLRANIAVLQLVGWRLWQKIVFARKLSELYKFIDSSNLPLPDFIQAYDRTLNT